MADRYWVGGTGNWSDATNHWATSSGGSPGAGNLPTTTDSVFFDSLSHTTNYTVTIDATTKNCLDFNMAAPLTNKVTWAGSVQINIYGNLNLSGGTAGITRTYTGILNFASTSGTKTISANGVTLDSATTFNGVGGTWQLSNAYNISAKSITLTNGTFNTNGYTLTANSISSSNSNVRTLTLGASTLTLSGTIDFTTATNLTFNANTSNITSTLSSAGIFNGGGKTFYNLTIACSFTSSASSLGGANTFNNLTITSSAGNINFSISANQTINGTLTITGTATIRIFLYSSILGTQRTFTAATTSLSYVDFQDIIGAGAAAWTGTRLGDADNNSGITFDAAVTRYWIGAGGNWNATSEWATSSGGASGASMPIAQDTAIFDANSFSAGSQVVTVNQDARIGTIDFTGVGADNPRLTLSGTLYVLNNFTLSSGMTLLGTRACLYYGRRNATFTSNGVSFDSSGGFTVNCIGTNTLTLGSDFTMTSAFTLTSGTFNANNYNLTATTINSGGTVTRTLTLGSGTMTATSISSCWNMNSSNLTFNAGTSTIKFTSTTSTARTFAGAGLTYYNFWSDAGTSTASLTISGSNTFNQFKDTGTVAHSILFTAGTTQTMTDWQVSGNSGQLITINSTTTATHTLSQASGTINANYLNIQHSVATGGATWNAGANSVNNQAVATAGSGWIFSGSSNIKSYNTNVLANIKSINTNVIANVKSLDTNTNV
jgi:hypothetical protein